MVQKKTKLNLNSIIDNGVFKNKKVIDIVNNNKKDIFKLVKEGLYFDDEVLALAGIKKTIKNVKTSIQIVEHSKDTKVYEIDKTPLQKILKEISTIDGYSMETIIKEDNDECEFDEDDDIDESEILDINDEE